MHLYNKRKKGIFLEYYVFKSAAPQKQNKKKIHKQNPL